jgi:alpha-methylacyl-CoA racemase
MKRPLEGIGILDLATLTPGKYCTCLLADLGASVLRVERPPGEPTPISAEDLVLNRGKRSLTLNLRSKDGRELLYRLVERNDVLIESNRPGVARRLGIDYESLGKRAERLIYCSLSGFGQDGPYSGRPGYDLIFVALSGALHALVGRRAPPFSPGLYLSDAVSGLTAAFAISVALLNRERSGEGAYLDLAMLDSIFSLLATSHGLQRGSQTPSSGEAESGSSPLYRVYETADGRHLALAAIRESSCRALFEALGRAELAAQARSQGEGAVRAGQFLERTFKTGTAAEWSERLAKLDVEIAPVVSPQEAFSDPQLAFRRMVLETAHPDAGALRSIGSPLRAASGARDDAPRPAPAVGADSAEVMRELGLAADEVARLREAGVI